MTIQGEEFENDWRACWKVHRRKKNLHACLSRWWSLASGPVTFSHISHTSLRLKAWLWGVFWAGNYQPGPQAIESMYQPISNRTCWRNTFCIHQMAVPLRNALCQRFSHVNCESVAEAAVTTVVAIPGTPSAGQINASWEETEKQPEQTANLKFYLHVCPVRKTDLSHAPHCWHGSRRLPLPCSVHSEGQYEIMRNSSPSLGGQPTNAVPPPLAQHKAKLGKNTIKCPSDPALRPLMYSTWRRCLVNPCRVKSTHRSSSVSTWS